MNLGLGDSQTEAHNVSSYLCGAIVSETEEAWVPGRVSAKAAAGAQNEARTVW